MPQQDAGKFLGHLYRIIHTDKRKRGWDEHKGLRAPLRCNLLWTLQEGPVLSRRPGYSRDLGKCSRGQALEYQCPVCSKKVIAQKSVFT